MTQQTSLPHLHMGCGEPLRSQWLLRVVHFELKTEAVVRKPNDERRKRGRARG